MGVERKGEKRRKGKNEKVLSEIEKMRRMLEWRCDGGGEKVFLVF